MTSRARTAQGLSASFMSDGRPAEVEVDLSAVAENVQRDKALDRAQLQCYGRCKSQRLRSGRSRDCARGVGGWGDLAGRCLGG